MFTLYAVQAGAMPGGGTLSFETEEGETESLHLSEHATAPEALAALVAAHATGTTRSTYADPSVAPPLWGHEVFQGARSDWAVCVARADRTGITLTETFASAAQPTTEHRTDPFPELEQRWM